VEREELNETGSELAADRREDLMVPTGVVDPDVMSELVIVDIEDVEVNDKSLWLVDKELVDSIEEATCVD
jgi:hypothetical protein